MAKFKCSESFGKDGGFWKILNNKIEIRIRLQKVAEICKEER
jgi:hypothetical protein